MQARGLISSSGATGPGGIHAIEVQLLACVQLPDLHVLS